MEFDELMEKGNQLRKEKKYEEALDAYQAALKADKRRPEAWNMKASTLGLMGQTDEAIECFDRSLELDFENEKTWFLKGMTLFAVNRFNEADSCLLEIQGNGFKPIESQCRCFKMLG